MPVTNVSRRGAGSWFHIPGLGRLTLRAALAQDLPVLQTGTLALVILAAVAASRPSPPNTRSSTRSPG
ncbi:hypothetical protein [Streptomyces peucetius]|nr:hypothetical protein CGZ69_35725 [Streptomyces peucetius subsp. caesius ATCC 27952]